MEVTEACATENSSTEMTVSDFFSSVCSACDAPIMVPWVRCAKCKPKVDICSQCFSYGAEFGQHENDHPYTVVTFSSPLFEPNWSAAEELRLLDAIQECGLGNWQAVSNRLWSHVNNRTIPKSEAECEKHYFKYYVENPHPQLPEFPDNITIDRGAPVIFKLSDDPPRPPEGSSLWLEMAGYSAARNDFNVEFDNFVEMDICHLTNDEDIGRGEDRGEYDEESRQRDSQPESSTSGDRELFTNLKMAVIDVYRNCLLERQRRKKIIRDYGLINIVFFRRRFDGSSAVGIFRPFMRLFPPVTFDKYMESLIYEKQLKTDISRLQEYRSNGMKQIRSVKSYKIMKQRRDSRKIQRCLLTGVLNLIKDEILCQTWLAKQAAALDSSNKSVHESLPNKPRKMSSRLYIEDLPGYEKLNEVERDMCSEVRFVPAAYLVFSKILVSECSKYGFLRLAQARTLIKIDVNKTRKLYDFLILHGQINKDPV